MNRQNQAAHHSDQAGVERIAFWSDAVIAIAITLLAIEIRLPELHDQDQLLPALLGLWPRFIGFFVSFFAIGSYWWVHHRVFRVMKRYDDTMIWLNIIFLMFIILVPFASSVISEHGNTVLGTIFYALMMMATGIAEVVLWLYVSHKHRLIDEELSDQIIRYSTARAVTPPSVFLLSIPLAFINPYIAMASWFSMFVIFRLLKIYYHFT